MNAALAQNQSKTPAGPVQVTNRQYLVFLQSDKFEVRGITTVSGDQWLKEETRHVLRLPQIANRTDVPVIQGATFPLINSKEESGRWEVLYRKLEYKGCWTERFEANRSTITISRTIGLTLSPRYPRGNHTSKRLPVGPQNSLSKW